ncbi:Uncharacterised protein [Mycobacteroides abscessus subsp. abscessus]|nr:Uncharacterised protein [Mycobacteroides abscessus subsp. abscessus]
MIASNRPDCPRSQAKASSLITRTRGSSKACRFSASSRGSVRARWIIPGSSSTSVTSATSG